MLNENKTPYPFPDPLKIATLRELLFWGDEVERLGEKANDLLDDIRAFENAFVPRYRIIRESPYTHILEMELVTDTWYPRTIAVLRLIRDYGEELGTLVEVEETIYELDGDMSNVNERLAALCRRYPNVPVRTVDSRRTDIYDDEYTWKPLQEK